MLPRQILRRVGLIERGKGPTLLGRGSEPRLLLLQAFLRRNGYPHTVVDADTDPDAGALLEFSAAARGDFPPVICPGGAVLHARPTQASMPLPGPVARVRVRTMSTM
ncbi:hypothetical protein ACU4GD_08095 [Cupriavidus basilensis]